MKNISILSLLLLPIAVFAQRITVSEPVSVRDDYSYSIIGDERGNVLLFRDQKTKFEVQGFDSNMRLSWEKEIELDKKNPEVLEVMPLGGDFGVIYQYRQKLQPVLKFHRYSSAANLLDSVTIKRFEHTFFTPQFEIELSEDKHSALIWYMENQNEFKVISFDIRQMKVSWELVFIPDGIVMHRDFSQMLADNAGNMYVVFKKDNIASKRKEHYLEVLDYGLSTGEVMRRYTVPMRDYLTYDVSFSFDNLNKKLKAAGFYSNDNPSKADGFFYLSISRENTSDQVLKFYPFEDEFIAVLLEKEKGKNKGLPEVSVQEIVHRMDGGIILIGEMNKEFQRGMATSTYYNRNGFRPITDYYFDDVFLISLHPDGELHWKNILHKKQYSQDDDAIYSSYFLAKTPVALRVVFNDEIKLNNTVSEYVIRGNGEYDRNAVMNTDRKDLSLRFRNAVQVAANEIVVPSERRNKLKLVRVSY